MVTIVSNIITTAVVTTIWELGVSHHKKNRGKIQTLVHYLKEGPYCLWLSGNSKCGICVSVVEANVEISGIFFI